MTDRASLPDDGADDRRTITDEFFEREVSLSREETAAFLRELADQLEAGPSFTVAGADWELPFECRDPVEVEVELEGRDEPELEIELEFDAVREDRDLSAR